jgi:uncharacterized protein involved in outer membrane biogenesis
VTVTLAPARQAAQAPRPRAPWGRLLAAVLVIALVVFLILFRWDWLRGPLARYLSGRLHRPVAITGHLHVHPWSWTPQATVTGLVIGTAPWAGKTPLATLPSITVQAKILPLVFRGQLILPLVEADHPDVELWRDKQGRGNWVIHPGVKAKPLKLPAINHLIIHDGALKFVDEQRHIRFTGTISSSEDAAGGGEDRGQFVMSGSGTLNGEAFIANVHGGPLIHVDPRAPYGFEASMAAGATRLRLVGRIEHPFDFGALSGRFFLQGPDLANLYGITGVVLPNTPPYSLSAGFARRQSIYALRHLNGRVGGSDLEGSLTVDASGARPMVTADLASGRLRLADMVAVVGGAPSHAPANELSPTQLVERARLKAEHRILPDARLDVGRIRSMDARVTFRATRIDAGKFPIDDLSFRLVLDQGLLTIDPLALTVSQGKLSGSVRIDARRATQVNAIDLRLTDARLGALVQSKDPNPPIEGGLWARARLTGTGDSVRAAAAHADGSVTGVMPGGAMRKTLANMLGINLDRTAFLLITRNKTDTPIRCAVADFQARDGVLTADRIVLDSDVVQVNGSGEVNLRDETLNLRLAGKPKKVSIVRLNAPITLAGPLDAPKIGVDVVHAIPQAAGAVALGVVAAPLAALLPFVEPGLVKNADCQALVGAAQAQGVRSPTPKAGLPGDPSGRKHSLFHIF